MHGEGPKNTLTRSVCATSDNSARRRAPSANAWSPNNSTGCAPGSSANCLPTTSSHSASTKTGTPRFGQVKHDRHRARPRLTGDDSNGRRVATREAAGGFRPRQSRGLAAGQAPAPSPGITAIWSATAANTSVHGWDHDVLRRTGCQECRCVQTPTRRPRTAPARPATPGPPPHASTTRSDESPFTGSLCHPHTRLLIAIPSSQFPSSSIPQFLQSNYPSTQSPNYEMI
jgi:hypothetical protein